MTKDKEQSEELYLRQIKTPARRKPTKTEAYSLEEQGYSPKEFS